jgi:integrase
MFNLAIDSKLRGCDVVAMRVEDVAAGGYTADRATVRQKKTGRPVRFELSEQTRQAVDDYLRTANKRSGQFLFTGRRGPNRNMTTRQYARLVSEWIGSVGLDPGLFGTHSLRRTKATLIYRRTGNLRAVQLLLGHTKIESTVRYLGIEVDDAPCLERCRRQKMRCRYHRALRCFQAAPQYSRHLQKCRAARQSRRRY